MAWQGGGVQFPYCQREYYSGSGWRLVRLEGKYAYESRYRTISRCVPVGEWWNSGYNQRPRNNPHGNGVQADMGCFGLLASTVIVSVLPAFAADAVRWGSPDNGVRIVGFGKKCRELRVTLQNVGAKDMLVPVGVKVDSPHLIHSSSSENAQWRNTKGHLYGNRYCGRVRGTADDRTSRRGDIYEWSSPVGRYFVVDGSEKLATFIKRRCQLWVELDVKENQCPNPTTLDPVRRTLPCWHGKIVSNVLQLPK